MRLTQAEYDFKRVQGTLTQQQITEFNEPGPFSLVSYLEALLGLSFYGEEVCIILISMMWQVRMTVVDAVSFIPTKFRYNNSLDKTDIILVRTAAPHYLPAGTLQFFTVSPCIRFIFAVLVCIPSALGLHINYIVLFLIEVHQTDGVGEDGSVVSCGVVKSGPLSVLRGL